MIEIQLKILLGVAYSTDIIDKNNHDKINIFMYII